MKTLSTAPLALGRFLCVVALLLGGAAGTAQAFPERLLPVEPMLPKLVLQYAHAAAYAERCVGLHRDRTMNDVMNLLDTYFPHRRVQPVVPRLHEIVDHIELAECSGEAIEEHLSEAFRLYEEAVQTIRESYGF